jgi:hypothetical protein
VRAAARPRPFALVAAAANAGEPRARRRILGGMSSAQIQALREAFDAASDGDIGPLVALFTPDTVWRGPARGRLWWTHTPS